MGKDRNLEHSNDWRTPQAFYDKLNEEFNFNFDPCPFLHADTMEWDGTKVSWGSSTFCNPPYSKNEKEAFIHKAIEESKKGVKVVMLLPVSTSTRIFHDHLLPNANEVRIIDGRIRFSGWNGKGEWVENKTGMHDSMLVIFDICNKKDIVLTSMVRNK